MKVQSKKNVKRVGDYFLIEPLFCDSFSQTLKGIDMISENFVSIKCFNKVLLSEAILIETITKEINLYCNLKHENILSFQFYFETNEDCCLVMDVCDNETLKRFCENAKEPLGEHKTLMLFKQILKIKWYLNENGVQNGVLEPSDLLFNDYELKLLNIGIISKLDPERLSSPFRSPELASNKNTETGFKEDVWNAGLLLFFLITRGVPKIEHSNNDNWTEYLKKELNSHSFPQEEYKALVVQMLEVESSKRIEWYQVYDEIILIERNASSALKTKMTASRIFYDSSEDFHLARKFYYQQYMKNKQESKVFKVFSGPEVKNSSPEISSILSQETAAFGETKPSMNHALTPELPDNSSPGMIKSHLQAEQPINEGIPTSSEVFQIYEKAKQIPPELSDSYLREERFTQKEDYYFSHVDEILDIPFEGVTANTNEFSVLLFLKQPFQNNIKKPTNDMKSYEFRKPALVNLANTLEISQIDEPMLFSKSMLEATHKERVRKLSAYLLRICSYFRNLCFIMKRVFSCFQKMEPAFNELKLTNFLIIKRINTTLRTLSSNIEYYLVLFKIKEDRNIIKTSLENERLKDLMEIIKEESNIAKMLFDDSKADLVNQYQKKELLPVNSIDEEEEPEFEKFLRESVYMMATELPNIKNKSKYGLDSTFVVKTCTEAMKCIFPDSFYSATTDREDYGLFGEFDFQSYENWWDHLNDVDREYENTLRIATELYFEGITN